jgi:hypothetical protein
LEQLDTLAPGQVSYVVLSDAQLAQLPAEQRARLAPLVYRGGNVLARWH